MKAHTVSDVKRLAIFSHFDVDNLIDDYIVYYLGELRKVATDIVFVSTAILPESEKSKITHVCKKIICRDNVGYDFFSYKVGLLNSGIDYRSYPELVICNDSVYGPITPLEGIFESMESRECDFWGITCNNKHKHVQSYFMVFRSTILASQHLDTFFSKIDIVNDKREIIMKYEVGLSQYLAGQGFAFSTYIPYPGLFDRVPVFFFEITKSIHYHQCVNRYEAFRKFLRILPGYFKEYIIHTTLNSTHCFWRYLLKKGSPFLKIELLRKNPRNMEDPDFILNEVFHHSNYPTGIITHHLSRTGPKY